MTEQAESLLARLQRATEEYDGAALDHACAALIAWAWSAPVQDEEAEKVVTAIREQRCWHALGAVASALLSRGKNLPLVRSCLVQSAIDGGELNLAAGVLQQLLTEHPDDPELVGMQGRLNKQRFVEAVAQGAPQAVREERLNDARDCYLRAYEREKSPWHGINALALTTRAKREGLSLRSRTPGNSFDALAVAHSLLETAGADLERGDDANAWSHPIFLTAALALNRPNDALTGALRYANAQRIGPFSYAATLRELREIWRLDERVGTMRAITAALESKIMALHGGGQVVLQSDSPARPEKQFVIDHMERELAQASSEHRENLERVFAGALVAFDSLLSGIARCDAIAWVENASSHRRMGTGFILSGDQLDGRLGTEPLLLTNAHVLNRDASDGALAPGNAAIFFQQGPNRARRFSVSEIIWLSPEGDLDVCVARLSEPPEHALSLVAPGLPSLDARSFIYVIGHAGGGNLSFSMMDNLLLDYDERVLHYRSPTEPGSSGSPVFDSDWQLLGIHHSGSERMRRLHGKNETYAANVGTRFNVLKQRFQAEWH